MPKLTFLQKLLDIFAIPTYSFMFDFFDDNENYVGSLIYTVTAFNYKRAFNKMTKELNRANIIGMHYTLDIERV